MINDSEIDIFGEKTLDREEERSSTLPGDYLICECFCVSADDIRSLGPSDHGVDLVKLEKIFGLGQGCGTCIKRKDEWIEKIFEFLA